MNTNHPPNYANHLVALLSEAVIAAGGEIRIKANSQSREGKALVHTVDEETGDSILRVVDVKQPRADEEPYQQTQW